MIRFKKNEGISVKKSNGLNYNYIKHFFNQSAKEISIKNKSNSWEKKNSTVQDVSVNKWE